MSTPGHALQLGEGRLSPAAGVTAACAAGLAVSRLRCSFRQGTVPSPGTIWESLPLPSVFCVIFDFLGTVPAAVCCWFPAAFSARKARSLQVRASGRREPTQSRDTAAMPPWARTGDPLCAVRGARRSSRENATQHWHLNGGIRKPAPCPLFKTLSCLETATVVPAPPVSDGSPGSSWEVPWPWFKGGHDGFAVCAKWKGQCSHAHLWATGPRP